MSHERLVELRAAGAEAVDGPGLRHSERLLDLAAELGGDEGARLQRRAGQRLEAIAGKLSHERQRLELALEGQRGQEQEIPEAIRNAVERGELSEARRGLQRLDALHARGLPRVGLERARRLASQVQQRELVLPPSLGRALARLRGQTDTRTETAVPGQPSAGELASRVARTLLAQQVSRVQAALAVLRAQRRVAPEAGPYNPELITAGLLSRLDRLAPGYLQAWVDHLGTLAALEKLPEATPHSPYAFQRADQKAAQRNASKSRAGSKRRR